MHYFIFEKIGFVLYFRSIIIITVSRVYIVRTKNLRPSFKIKMHAIVDLRSYFQPHVGRLCQEATKILKQRRLHG